MRVKLDQPTSVDAALELLNADGRASHWPSRDENNRLEPSFAPILTPRFRIAPHAKIFTIGSCFARAIEENLALQGFCVPMLDFAVPKTEYPFRPNGILNKFTPPTMLQEVRRAAVADDDWHKVDAEAELLLFPAEDGLVIDMELGAYIPVTRERAIERRRQVHRTFLEAFDSDLVIVTMGSIEGWLDTATGLTLEATAGYLALMGAEHRFSFRLLDVAEAYADMSDTIETLVAHGKPGKKIVVTVSPVPVANTFTGMDVVVANCFAKSALRTVAQQLCNNFDCVDYFPAYEMVVYSRDPDTWEDDLVHVTDHFVEKIVDTMLAAYLRPADIHSPRSVFA